MSAPKLSEAQVRGILLACEIALAHHENGSGDMGGGDEKNVRAARAWAMRWLDAKRERAADRAAHEVKR